MDSMWELLQASKARAGCDPDRVVWVSAVTVARTKWCQWAAVVEAREAEVPVFRAWLADRAQLAVAAGVVRAASGSPEELADLAFSESVPSGDVFGGDGLLGLSLVPGGQSGGGPRRWMRRGEFFLCAEPDGTENSTVVEREETMGIPAKFAWPVASLHADLCGLVLGTNKKRVTVGDRSEAGLIDLAGAEAALDLFRRLEAGECGPLPPRAWKCRDCEAWEDCVLGPRLLL